MQSQIYQDLESEDLTSMFTIVSTYVPFKLYLKMIDPWVENTLINEEYFPVSQRRLRFF